MWYVYAQQQQQKLEAQKEMLESFSAQLTEAKRELAEMKHKETERLETIQSKVKEALFAKDQTIQRLEDQLSASNTKVRTASTLL